MPRFLRAVLIGAALVLCIEFVQMLIVRATGGTPLWTLLANAAAYAFTGLRAAEPPALRHSALDGGIVGLINGVAALGLVYVGGIVVNQTPWLVFIPFILGIAVLAGTAIGALGGLVARRRAHDSAHGGA